MKFKLTIELAKLAENTASTKKLKQENTFWLCLQWRLWVYGVYRENSGLQISGENW